MFLSLDLLWEYRIQHGANEPLYVTSSYSTWIFCRGVSGFATDCPCGVWCRVSTHLPPACWSTFWKSNFKQQLGCRFDIMDNKSYFFVFWHMQLYVSWYIKSFFGFTFLNILYFFKYSCTNIFHRRSLYTFYSIARSLFYTGVNFKALVQIMVYHLFSCKPLALGLRTRKRLWNAPPNCSFEWRMLGEARNLTEFVQSSVLHLFNTSSTMFLCVPGSSKGCKSI